MKYLLTGDWHLKKGIRTQIILDFLDYLFDYYKNNHIDKFVILGDVFDKSVNIKNEAFIPLHKKLYEMRKNGVEFVFIVGNHDIININNESVVETFEPIGDVITENVHDAECDNWYAPYTKDINKIPKNGKVLFTHLSIADFSFDNAYHATEKHAFPRATFENFQFVFTGHFHRHQVWKNIVYVGSPCQMNRGEMGQKKGFVIFDDERESWEFIKYNKAPTYIEIDEENIMNLKEMNFENKFVVVRPTRKIKDFGRLKYVLYEKGAVDVIPIFESEEESPEIEEDVEINASLEDIVKEVILKSNFDKIDNNELIEVFEKVLKEA